MIESHSDPDGAEWADEVEKKPFEDNEGSTQTEKTLTCFILMLDVFLKQVGLVNDTS